MFGGLNTRLQGLFSLQYFQCKSGLQTPKGGRKRSTTATDQTPGKDIQKSSAKEERREDEGREDKGREDKERRKEEVEVEKGVEEEGMEEEKEREGKKVEEEEREEEEDEHKKSMKRTRKRVSAHQLMCMTFPSYHQH